MSNNIVGKSKHRMNYECDDKCATCPSIGSFNRKPYDNCSYKKKIGESTAPLPYMMSRFKFENCSSCTLDGNYYAPFDLVDYESELLNITRPDSDCDQLKYSPNCVKSDMCISTYERGNPVVAHRNVCPVVCNNIKKMKTPGYVLKPRQFCGRDETNKQEQLTSEDNYASVGGSYML